MKMVSQLPFLSPLLQLKLSIWKEVYAVSIEYRLVTKILFQGVGCPQQYLIQSLEGKRKASQLLPIFLQNHNVFYLHV